MNDKQIKEEQEYLEKTINVIEDLLKEHEQTVDLKIADINEMRQFIWENKDNMDGGELQANLDMINMDVFVTNENIKYVNNLKRSEQSPYFGRIDFEDEYGKINVYIGLNGIKADQTFWVYDWRAPIASLFYNYDIGKCSYDVDGDKIEGNICLKRQYKIKEQKLVRCFDSNIVIDDEYLQEVLSSPSSSQMRNIVDTIQREQNQIIRNDKDKVLIVQGIAGSGKTSVALHRIAYLLYKEKGLTSNSILIFSPNDIFSKYISNVLPELGENNVLQTTFYNFITTYLKKTNVENLSEFLDRYYNNRIQKAKFDEIKYKQSDVFYNLLDKHLKEYHQKLKLTDDLLINNNLIIYKDEINKLLTHNLVNLGIYEKIEYIIRHICESRKLSYNRYKNILKNKIISLLSAKIDFYEVYNDFLRLNNLDEVGSEKIYYEDSICLLYVLFELYGYPYSYNIKHIVIDEVQDYNLMQLKIISKVFRNAKFTILGDLNQTINPYYEYKSLNDINTQIFNNSARYIELLKTYRSSESIIQYTNKLLGLDNVCAIRHDNNFEVEFKNIDDDGILENLKEDIINMKENNMNNIAIITKDCIETEKLYSILKNHFSNLSKILNEKNKEIKEITIIPAFLSKGLEFDGVIVYTDKSNYFENKDNKLLYVACTRAQHKLILYNQKGV